MKRKLKANNKKVPDFLKSMLNYANFLIAYNYPNEKIVVEGSGTIIYRSKVKKCLLNLLKIEYKVNKDNWFKEHKRNASKLEKKLEKLVDKNIKQAFISEQLDAMFELKSTQELQKQKEFALKLGEAYDEISSRDEKEVALACSGIKKFKKEKEMER